MFTTRGGRCLSKCKKLYSGLRRRVALFFLSIQPNLGFGKKRATFLPRHEYNYYLLACVYVWRAADSAFEEIVAFDDFEGVKPREEGVEPSTFDVQSYHRKRMHAPFYDVIPQKFRQINLSKPFEQLEPDVCVSRQCTNDYRLPTPKC